VVFFGTYTPRLDDKGRLILPAKFRDQLAGGLMTRDYIRMFSSASSDETPDKQGRITIPPKLRDWASLGKEVVVIGAMNRLEIWDEAAWAAYSEEQEEAFAELSEEVFPGI
jgi:MraZ protein